MAIVTKFNKATRQRCKASVLIEGLSGSGKSGLGLSMAYALAGNDWNKVAAVDTENKSLPLYVGRKLHTGAVVEKDQLNIGYLTAEDGFKPSHYAAWRDEAIRNEMSALICDSISHMWQYKGGVLDIVNKLQNDNPKLNNYQVWGSPEVAAEKNIIFGMIRHHKIHCINTVRVKEKMEFLTEDGKTSLKSLGEQQIVTPDLKYEPDLVLHMEEAGTEEGKAPVVTVIKSRYSPFKVNDRVNVTGNLINQLRLFLEEGTSPEELDEMQRQEYITAITEYLDENDSAKAIWKPIKKQAGVDGLALKDMPLNKLKILFRQLLV